MIIWLLLDFDRWCFEIWIKYHKSRLVVSFKWPTLSSMTKIIQLGHLTPLLDKCNTPPLHRMIQHVNDVLKFANWTEAELLIFNPSQSYIWHRTRMFYNDRKKFDDLLEAGYHLPRYFQSVYQSIWRMCHPLCSGPHKIPYKMNRTSLFHNRTIPVLRIWNTKWWKRK